MRIFRSTSVMFGRRRKGFTLVSLLAALVLLIAAAPAAHAAAPKTQIGFAPTSYSIGEGGGTAILTVTRSGNLATTTTVAFQTESGGSGVTNAATAPGDYIVAAGTVAFTNGEKIKTIIVPINDDVADEVSETFSVRLVSISNADSSSVTFKKSSNVAKVTITDNDLAGSFSVESLFAATEGDAILFNVTLTPNGTQATPAQVRYATADSGATAGADYTAKSGTLTFNPGVPSTQTVTVQTHDDLADEGSEGFLLNLSSPVNATISDDSAVGLILDDDVVADATVTVIKQADPEGPTSFDFNATGAGLPADFDLVDDGTPTNVQVFTITSANQAGAKTITETVPSGWTLTSADCTGVTETPVTNGVTFTVTPGDEITCTFTDVEDATLTIVKQAAPEGPTSFDFDATGTGIPSDIDLVDDGTSANTVAFTLDASELGTKTVVENVPAGWTLNSATCNNSGTPITDGVSIDVDAGDDITCTFGGFKNPEILPYSVTGTLVSLTADDPITPAFEGTVTITVTAANQHATDSGEIADQDAGTPGVQVAGATYTVSSDPYVLTLLQYQGADTPSPGDVVQLEGTILFAHAVPPGTSTADRYASPDEETVTITDSDPDA